MYFLSFSRTVYRYIGVAMSVDSVERFSTELFRTFSFDYFHRSMHEGKHFFFFKSVTLFGLE